MRKVSRIIRPIKKEGMTRCSAPVVIPKSTYRAAALIVYLSVDCTAVSTLGKAFLWRRLRKCPRCRGSRVWGHGYVERYFDGVHRALWMKRWRCPDCHAVHTMRPDSHWRGFWADRSTILGSLKRKEVDGQWLPDLGRERQQYWWRGFWIQRQFHGSHESLASLVEGQIIAATHSFTHREIHLLESTPYPIFAFTPPLRGP